MANGGRSQVKGRGVGGALANGLLAIHHVHGRERMRWKRRRGGEMESSEAVSS